MSSRLARGLHGLQRVVNLGSRARSRPLICIVRHPSSSQVRQFYRGRDNPFLRMEEFMRDMENKFKRDMDSMFKDLPRIIESGLPRVSEVKPKPRFGEVVDVSTADTYKMAFSFPNAAPENVKVSLKGKTLSVSGSAEDVTETSKSSQQFSIQFEIPEGINLDAMESSMSHEGILTIEAPRIPTEAAEAPRSINIERE